MGHHSLPAEAHREGSLPKRSFGRQGEGESPKRGKGKLLFIKARERKRVRRAGKDGCGAGALLLF